MPHTPLTIELVALLVDRMASNFRTQVTEAQVEVWFEHICGVDAEVAGQAADAVIENEKFFPTMAVFKGHVADILRARAREDIRTGWAGPNPNCGFCHGDEWYETVPLTKAINQPIVDERTQVITGYEVVHVDYEQWRPCEQCNPVGMELWEKHKAELRRRARLIPADSDEQHHFAKLAKDTLESMVEP